MDHSILLVAVCLYVETRARGAVDTAGLERAVGYSYAHIRRTFRRELRVSFARYVLLRRLSYAAFDLVHTDRTLTDIALDCGFAQYDAFTRAFKREVGMTPSDFRRRRGRAGRGRIAGGFFAPAILERGLPIEQIKEVPIMGENQGGILLGVPQIGYHLGGECTPFPMCLKACLNYLGQDVRYSFLMAATGAAFRLRWNRALWDGGNVDITYIYPEPTEAFLRGFRAAGRSVRFLQRENSDKQGFFDFIKREIDAGRPVIALGVIGPPEAGIVAGYREADQALLGWNVFQNRPEYNKGTEIHECGYYICRDWWENPDTQMLMAIGEGCGAPVSDREILENGLRVEERDTIYWDAGDAGDREDTGVACGQKAFETWSRWIADDRQFDGITLPMLQERFMCQMDAQTMIAEGRTQAAEYLEAVALRHPEVRAACERAAEAFRREAAVVTNMDGAIFQRDASHEENAWRFARPEVRARIAGWVMEAAGIEREALAAVREVVAGMAG